MIGSFVPPPHIHTCIYMATETACSQAGSYLVHPGSGLLMRPGLSGADCNSQSSLITHHKNYGLRILDIFVQYIE